jgi:hypothetical protein
VHADQTEKKRRETSLIVSGLEPCSTSDQDLFSDLCQTELRNCNSRKWWQETKKLTGQVSRPELQTLINSSADGNVQLFADQVNQFLADVSRNLQPLSLTLSSQRDQTSTSNSHTFDITPYEVFNRLSRINIYKSPGPDGLPNWFLRDFAFAISEPVSHIFNSSVQNGVVPSLWKMANVVPSTQNQTSKINPGRFASYFTYTYT